MRGTTSRKIKGKEKEQKDPIDRALKQVSKIFRGIRKAYTKGDVVAIYALIWEAQQTLKNLENYFVITELLNAHRLQQLNLVFSTPKLKSLKKPFRMSLTGKEKKIFEAEMRDKKRLEEWHRQLEDEIAKEEQEREVKKG